MAVRSPGKAQSKQRKIDPEEFVSEMWIAEGNCGVPFGGGMVDDRRLLWSCASNRIFFTLKTEYWWDDDDC